MRGSRWISSSTPTPVLPVAATTGPTISPSGVSPRSWSSTEPGIARGDLATGVAAGLPFPSLSAARKAARPTPMNVPLLDLKAQFAPIREAILGEIVRVCDAQYFVLG